MQTIADLLRSHVPPARVFDRQLAWGAKASAYAAELRDAADQGLVPVLVELEPDIALPDRTILIDHHGPRAGRDQPTSLQQVFELLGLPPESWTRWLALVAANDRGYVGEMQALGASGAELKQVREADRRAQGVTPDQEQAAETAIAMRQLFCSGRLTVVRIPHEKTSAVADRLEPALGGPGFENLLVCAPRTTTLYGSGPLVDVLRRHFPEGWWGGALPDRGYWGSNRREDEVLPALLSALAESANDPPHSRPVVP